MYYQIWCELMSQYYFCVFLLFVYYNHSEIDKNGIYHVNSCGLDFDKHFKFYLAISSASINLFSHNELYWMLSTKKKEKTGGKASGKEKRLLLLLLYCFILRIYARLPRNNLMRSIIVLYPWQIPKKNTLAMSRLQKIANEKENIRNKNSRSKFRI